MSARSRARGQQRRAVVPFTPPMPSASDLRTLMRVYMLHHEGQPPCCMEHHLAWVLEYAIDVAGKELSALDAVADASTTH